MNQLAIDHDVLTLQEAAAFLRLPEPTVVRLVQQQGLPGRQIDEEWRFLRSAIEDWLRKRSGKDAFLAQAGALAADPTLPELLKRIYEERGRPETPEG